MSTVLHPVGPQRARVYWVRRLLVVVVVVALAVLATTAVSWLRGDGEQPAAAAAGQPSSQRAGAGAPPGDGPDAGATDADADADDDAEADPADDADEAEADADVSTSPGECAPQALQLTLTGSAVEFDAATNPVLTATVTNVGDAACTVDAGDVTREVLVTSGEDRIWSTKDCATEESGSRQLLLGPGAADSAEIEWPRTRSAEGCPGDLPAPRAGTYQAVATLGGLTSQTVVFILG